MPNYGREQYSVLQKMFMGGKELVEMLKSI